MKMAISRVRHSRTESLAQPHVTVLTNSHSYLPWNERAQAVRKTPKTNIFSDHPLTLKPPAAVSIPH
jgi:hypothetical protein